MKDKYYVGAYWLARQECAEACARRAETFFRLLASCDSIFTHWFDKGWTLEQAQSHRLEPEAATFLRRWGGPRASNTTEGFSLDVWNGELREAASSVLLDCGNASPWVPNACLLNLPVAGAVAQRLLSGSGQAQLLRAMALAWEPEWGVATSDEHRDALFESPEPGAFLGPVTYFSHGRGPLPTLPSPVLVQPVEDKGTLVLLPEPFSHSSDSHRALARECARRLSQAGLLGPLRPWVR